MSDITDNAWLIIMLGFAVFGYLGYRWLRKRSDELEAGIQHESDDTPIRLRIRIRLATLLDKIPGRPKISSRVLQTIVVIVLIYVLYRIRSIPMIFLTAPLWVQVIIGVWFVCFVGAFVYAKIKNLGPTYVRHREFKRPTSMINPWTGQPREPSDDEKMQGAIEP